MSKYVERVIDDILDPQTLLPAVEGVDWLFHAAAQSDYWRHPKLVLPTRTEGPRNVMQAANQDGVKRAVSTSSSFQHINGLLRAGFARTSSLSSSSPGDL